MRIDEIPYTDPDANIHTKVRVYWDILVVKMPGLARWRTIIPVERMTFLDGKPIPGGMLKTFCVLRYSSYWSLYDARQGLASSNPIQASQIIVEPIRAIKEYPSQNVSMFFQAWTSREYGIGVSKSALIPDPRHPGRSISKVY